MIIGKKSKTVALAGAIRKTIVWLIIGILFRDFLLGRLIIYIILFPLLGFMLWAMADSVGMPQTDKIVASKSHTRNGKTVPVPVMRTKGYPRTVKIGRIYDWKENKGSRIAKRQELVLMEVSCKNCGGSELKNVGQGLYSCVYCGTTYRSRE